MPLWCFPATTTQGSFWLSGLGPFSAVRDLPQVLFADRLSNPHQPWAWDMRQNITALSDNFGLAKAVFLSAELWSYFKSAPIVILFNVGALYVVQVSCCSGGAGSCFLTALRVGDKHGMEVSGRFGSHQSMERQWFQTFPHHWQTGGVCNTRGQRVDNVHKTY